MAVLVALVLVIFLVSVAFSVDVAYMQLSRTRLRTATDAAARAGGEALSRTQDVDSARTAAKGIAAMNLVAGQPLLLADEDIHFGNSSPDESGVWQFTEGGEPLNSVRVQGRRTRESPSGSVPLFFGRALGMADFQPTHSATAVRLDRDICLVVDRSGSMAWDLSGRDGRYPPGGAECKPPHATLSRWAALREAVSGFMDAVAETEAAEYVSLVSYASDGTWCGTTKNAADIEQTLTDDYSLVLAAMTRISSAPIPGRTSISAGIDEGVRVLTDRSRARPYAAKTLVVLTDGHHNTGRSPIDAARDAVRNDLTIHTVTFSTGADQDLMRQVAEIGGGRHYHAPDASRLKEIFREIALTLPVVLTE